MKFLFPTTLFLSLCFQLTFAQTTNTNDLYFDFTNYRMARENKVSAIEKALILLSHKSELNVKQQANVNYHIGRLYEEIDEPEKSIPYYEETIKLSPGYYVPYRALGFINLKKCNELGIKMNEAAKAKNTEMYAKLLADYKKQVLKTIPYLEKTQACDPDEQTLDMITKYYKSIKASNDLVTLPERLKRLSENCITLLPDE